MDIGKMLIVIHYTFIQALMSFMIVAMFYITFHDAKVQQNSLLQKNISDRLYQTK